MSENTQVGGRLVTHRGARKVGREQLLDLPTPIGTDTWKPVSHYDLVCKIGEQLAKRDISIVREQYAVQKEDNLLFGVLDLSMNYGDYGGSLGIRTSNDKSLSLSGVAGARVFVCDNLALNGEMIVLRRKHTAKLDIVAEIEEALDKFQLHFMKMQRGISKQKDFMLGDSSAKELIYTAFVDKEVMPLRLLPVVHKEFFEPSFDYVDAEHNLWLLNNAFTSAAKELKPASQMKHLGRVGQFIDYVLA